MGRCSICGTLFLPTPKDKCVWCGRAACEKCARLLRGGAWLDLFKVKTTVETSETKAGYKYAVFCSETCKDAFWQNVMDYPLDDIGTNVNHFVQNVTNLFYAAVLHALNGNPETPADIIAKVKRAKQIETENSEAIPVGILNDGTIVVRKDSARFDFINHAYSALARNLERCGRPVDAAEIYEKNLKLYDKARQLRERDKHVIAHTFAAGRHITVNLNTMLQQLKDGVIVPLYRCPHCNGMLKIGKDTSQMSLKTCQYCGAQIETVDLFHFLTRIVMKELEAYLGYRSIDDQETQIEAMIRTE